MSDLNAEQSAVVKSRKGARCVISGPGSGKTKTMVELVETLRNEGVPASSIRCVTFSKEAAETIAKRSGIKGVFSTFHSLGYQICSELAAFKPVEPELRHRLMSKLCRKWRLEYKDLDTFISRMRHADITPEQAAEAGEYDYGECSAYAEYERVRAAEGWMDFDSMLCDAVQLLEIAQNRARYQYEYLIVDEGQDTDNLQWRLMQQLSEKHGNITVVGDPNQAIYGFRGAKPENLTNFERWFQKGHYYYLGRNYRSTQTIVKFVRENVPRGCPTELVEKMVAARKEVGVPIGLKMYRTEDEEAESAVKLSQSDPLNTAILARTNEMLGGVERVCNRYGIRYHLLGKSGFWKQNEIRKAIDALKDYENLRVDQAMSLAMPTVEARYAVDDRTERDNHALANLKVLRIIAKDFPRAKDFVVYANKMIHRRNDPRGVILSTIHQAKGGEWKNVFVIGARAKMIPHQYGDANEEERIYFVAISRAVDRLRLSWAGTPSPYLYRRDSSGKPYITEEIEDLLQAKVAEVDRFESQERLFA